MPPAIEELPSGQPPGQQPHRRQSRRVRKIDFGQLDGLSTSADQELRETEDALVAFMAAGQARRALCGYGALRSFVLRLLSLIVVMRPAIFAPLGRRDGRSPVVVWQLFPTDQPDVIHALPIPSISGVVQGLGIVG